MSSIKFSVKILSIILLVNAYGNFTASASEIDGFKKIKLYSEFRNTKKQIQDDKEKLIQLINKQINNEEYTKAMLELNKLMAEEPDDVRVYVLSAKLLRKTSRFDEAEKKAKEALRLDYKNSEAYLELGYIFLDRSKKETNSENAPQKQREYLLKSFDYFFLASQYDQTNAFPHIALAEAYYTNKQKDKAKDEILKARDLCFDSPEAIYELGQYYYRTNDYKKAQKYIQKSLEMGQTSNYNAYFFAGKIAEEEGRIEDAQKQYLKVLKIKPDMLEAQKHLDKLIKTSYKKRQLVENKPEDPFESVDENLTTLMKADYYLMIDEYTRARDLYIELLEKNPENYNASAGLAELYYSKWREGFSNCVNFTKDGLYVMKTKPSNKNRIALLKFRSINEVQIPENIRQELIKLSVSETFEFYDLLNEVRAEFLLGNFEESHNKLQKFLNMKLSNYEKFKILKHLCYDRNYYEALFVLDNLKKTYYHNEEIEPVEKRLNTKLHALNEKIEEASLLCEKAEEEKEELLQYQKYSQVFYTYLELIHYFPTYKPAYLHYALGLELVEKYQEAYEILKLYQRLNKLYPDENPEVTEEELEELMEEMIIKIQEQREKAQKQSK